MLCLLSRVAGKPNTLLVGVHLLHGSLCSWGFHWKFQGIAFQFQHEMKNGFAAENFLFA